MLKKLRDRINIISKLTFQRLLNLVLLELGYWISVVLRKPIVWGKPYSVSIEPTTSCNLRCPECPSGLRQFSRNTGMLSYDLYKKILDQLSDSLIYLILYFQGEPYLNPSFFEMVKLARQKRIYSATSTNAHFLTEENARKTVESGLDRLIISLDGIGQDIYSTYRVGGRYQRVLDGIKNLVEAKAALKSNTPHIVVQFIVFKTNEHQLEDVKKLCRDLKVDELQFKTAQFYNYKNGNPLIPTLDKYSRYKKMPDGTYAFKNKLPDRCHRMTVGCVITWDGLVVPCCFDKDAEQQMGDLKTLTFGEVWQNPVYKQFRQGVYSNRKGLEMCRNCTEGM